MSRLIDCCFVFELSNYSPALPLHMGIYAFHNPLIPNMFYVI